METSSRGRTALLTTLGVLVALAVVAIAARGLDLGRRRHDARRRATRCSTSSSRIYLLALIGGAVAFVYLLVLRRRVDARAGRGKRRSLLESLLSFVLLVGVGVLLARRLSTWERPIPVEPEEAVGRAGSIAGNTSAEPLAPYEAGVAWIAGR